MTASFFPLHDTPFPADPDYHGGAPEIVLMDGLPILRSVTPSGVTIYDCPDDATREMLLRSLAVELTPDLLPCAAFPPAARREVSQTQPNPMLPCAAAVPGDAVMKASS